MLLAGCAVGYGAYRQNYAVDATVSLDVNPSVEIQVNRKDQVLEVTPLNEDGKRVIGDMDFSGSDLDVTVNALIGSMLQNGYLSELANSLPVSYTHLDVYKRQAVYLLASQVFTGSAGWPTTCRLYTSRCV